MRVLTLLCALLPAVTRAFVPVGGRQPIPLALSANPLNTLFSVLKEGKVGLVKSLAGDYDADAVRGKLDNLVAGNPVLMLSFTT